MKLILLLLWSKLVPQFGFAVDESGWSLTEYKQILITSHLYKNATFTETGRSNIVFSACLRPPIAHWWLDFVSLLFCFHFIYLVDRRQLAVSQLVTTFEVVRRCDSMPIQISVKVAGSPLPSGYGSSVGSRSQWSLCLRLQVSQFRRRPILNPK